jgi:hypothetical protein
MGGSPMGEFSNRKTWAGRPCHVITLDDEVLEKHFLCSTN